MRQIASWALGLTLAGMSMAAGASVINLNATVRDFCGYGFGASVCPTGYTPNVDFERAIADDRGIVTSTLGADGTPVYAWGNGYSAAGTVTNQTWFNQWYHDTPGYNQRTNISLALSDAGNPGTYTYDSSAFFPIDNQLLGNEGQSHNFSFTLQLHTAFTYQTGQTFSFAGDDDVWVYINNQRVIDLGGVHGSESASVNLDTLGLTAGNDYNFDLFFAERHTSGSDLKIQTSILFHPNPVPEPADWTLFAAGLLGLSLLRRRRRPV